ADQIRVRGAWSCLADWFLDGGHKMAASSQKRRLSREARRALELLAGQEGSTEALKFAHGFTDLMLLRLVRAGLITVRYELITIGRQAIDVGRIGITDAGRLALEGEGPHTQSRRLRKV